MGLRASAAFRVLAFRVWGLGFVGKVPGLGFMGGVGGLGFRVYRAGGSGLGLIGGLRVSGLEASAALT